ncbi:MAG TPA: ATP synthase F1 subunit gamma [Clostridia bacterium]|jgi:F-type H+-transporting ATPase subunit gamma|nr:ATP synthase F1 subunit gamma [Clostridia bacterium]
MPNVREIRRRMRGVENIQQITQAMKMVAASKLRRTQMAVARSRPYTQKLQGVLSTVITSMGEINHPLFVEKPLKKVCLVLITADKGLAGGYNTRVQRLALEEAERYAEQGVKVDFLALGEKGRAYLKRREQEIKKVVTGINDVPTFDEAQKLARFLVNIYLNEEYDRIYLVYQEFVTTVQQRPIVKQFLPLVYEKDETALEEEYIYEPSPQAVLSILLPRYINNLAFHLLTETKASEHGARMTAMTSATDNAEEMLEELRLSYNRSRQANITREISEIVGGADALEA